MVRALEPARLSSNRVSINTLARILPSSTRLESALTQLSSNSNAQLDESDRVNSSQIIQYNILLTLRQGPLLLIRALQSYCSNEYWVVNNCNICNSIENRQIWSCKMEITMFVYIFCKQIADFFCLAQLDSARILPCSTQLEVLFIKVWLDSAQLKRLQARLSSTREIAGSNHLYPGSAWKSGIRL